MAEEADINPVTDETTPPSTEEAIMNSIDEGEPKDESTPETKGTQGELTLEGDPGKAKSKDDKPGPSDLVGADGQVIAKSGAERRLYENAQNASKRAETAERERDSLKGQVEGIEKANSIATQLNLTPDEQVAGMRTIAAYKEDPIGTIKYLLTQAQANGHNIDDIGGSSVDMAAIKRMLDTHLAPLAEERAEKEKAVQAEQTAKTAYNDFVVKYPDAPLHGDSIARLIERDPTLTPEAAYLKLKLFYMEKSLDFTKPLDTLDKEQKGDPSKTPQATIPSGGSVVDNADPLDKVASVDTSYEDIIRESIADMNAGT